MQYKPVVHGLSRDLASTADVLQVDLTSIGGEEIARRYGVRYSPAFVVLDARGDPSFRVLPDYLVASLTPAFRVFDKEDTHTRRSSRLDRALLAELVRAST